jgi:hypothetical protein
VNYGLALALFLLALAFLVIGWRGTYTKAWQVLTGQSSTFGQGPGGTVANPAATGAQAAASGNAAAGAGAAAIAQQVTNAINAILTQNGINPALAPAPSGNVAGTVGGLVP